MNWTDDTADLARLIDRTLVAGRLALAFETGLERRFKQDTEPARRQGFWSIGLVAIALYDVFLVDDFQMMPDLASWAVLVRLGIVTPLALLALWLVPRYIRWPPIYDLVKAGFAVTVAAQLCVFSLLSTAPWRGHIVYGMLLVVIFANVFSQMDFRVAVAASVLIAAAFVTTVLTSGGLPGPLRGSACMMLLGSVALTLVANYRLEREARRAYLFGLRDRLRAADLSESNRQLAERSARDALTGLANRHGLADFLDRTWLQQGPTGQPVGLLMLDVDRFKDYNDSYGHPAGDDCLCIIAAILREHVRSEVDLVARYGGEEFVAVMPGQDLAASLRIAERVRRAIEAARIGHEGGIDGVVTASLGVASAPAGQASGPEALIAKADAALYAAKRAGRNRVWPLLSATWQPVSSMA